MTNAFPAEIVWQSSWFEHSLWPHLHCSVREKANAVPTQPIFRHQQVLLGNYGDAHCLFDPADHVHCSQSGSRNSQVCAETTVEHDSQRGWTKDPEAQAWSPKTKGNACHSADHKVMNWTQTGAHEKNWGWSLCLCPFCELLQISNGSFVSVLLHPAHQTEFWPTFGQTPERNIFDLCWKKIQHWNPDFCCRYPDEPRDISIPSSDGATSGVTTKALVPVKQTPSNYRRLNDTLTILTGLLAVILVVKNTLLGTGILTIRDTSTSWGLSGLPLGDLGSRPTGRSFQCDVVRKHVVVTVRLGST